MKLVLHIFKKDVRLLWPHVLVTFGIVAFLAHEDRWRGDWLAGRTEGWLNLLLPVAWTFLIGLVVGQEALAGSRQFWITRPYRRGTLLASKALFVLAFIHLPFLLEQAYVLAARGFSPLSQISDLLWNQVVLAASLTLPAIALATLASTFTQFVMEVVGVAAAVVFLTNTFHAVPMFYWDSVAQVRESVVIVIVALASVAIVAIQYFGRRVVLSRGLGIGAGIAAGTLFAMMMPASAFALRSAMAPIPEALTLAPRDNSEALPDNWKTGSRTTVAIPVRIAGLPAGAPIHAVPLDAEIASASGRYRSATPESMQNFERIAFNTYVLTGADDPSRAWLMLFFDRGIYDRIKDQPVEISGENGITAYRLGQTSSMAANAAAAIPGVGRCASSVIPGRFSEDMLKVECESTASLPLHTHANLVDTATGRAWNAELADSRSGVTGPRTTWLSALDRKQTVFRLADDPKGFGSQWLVPVAALSTAKVTITPEIVTGYSVLKYRLTGVTLSKYRQ